MKRTKRTLGLLCVGVILTAMIGGTFASQGTEANPLVTLSYLNETVIPEILKQVDEKLAAKTDEVTREAAAAGGALFTTVELQSGQSVTLSAGAQLLVRAGTVNTLAAMSDLTDGTTWNSAGAGMPANHLYLATGEDQTVTASTAATVMIQGGYQKQ